MTNTVAVRTAGTNAARLRQADVEEHCSTAATTKPGSSAARESSY